MKLQVKNKELLLSIYIFALLLLLEGVSSRGVTGGGGPAGNSSGGISSSGHRGLYFGSRTGRSGNSVTTGAGEKAPSGPPQSKLTGAYLIPGGGSSVLPLYPYPQEVKSYYRREGSGMSAWGIIALILGIIGGGTVAWFCYMVGLPMWRDRRRRHSLMMSESMRRPGHEGIPLQETPSTATPSPCIAVCLPS